jgi:hypothetical protein
MIVGHFSESKTRLLRNVDSDIACPERFEGINVAKRMLRKGASARHHVMTSCEVSTSKFRIITEQKRKYDHSALEIEAMKSPIEQGIWASVSLEVQRAVEKNT